MFAMPNSTIIPFGGKTPKIATGVLIASGARLIGDLEIGEDASIWFNTVVRADCHYIRIGARTNIQDNSVIHITQGTAPTVIGSEVTVGHAAIIHGCTIADRCLIGMGSVILDGAIIRENSLVAAGALVPPGKEYPPGSLIRGSPATVARPLRPDEIECIKQSVLNYLTYKKGYMPG